MRALLLLLVVTTACFANSSPPATAVTPAPATAFDATQPREGARARFELLTQRLQSPCGRATSVRSDVACKRRPYALAFLHWLIDSGTPDDLIASVWHDRYVTAERHRFALASAPMLGTRDARVEIVVFEDYECPHCAALAPVLDELLRRYGDRIAVWFKQFPIVEKHAHAADAATAALAAHQQGKFAELHAQLMSHQQELGPADLEHYALAAGLDLDRFRADMDAHSQLRVQVAEDRAEGDRDGIDATPAIFIDGRAYKGPGSVAELASWIEEELAVR